MKKKDLNQFDKKKKQINPPKEKPEEKVKEQKIISQMISEKQNLPNSSTNNPKDKKESNLTDLYASVLSRKK